MKASAVFAVPDGDVVAAAAAAVAPGDAEDAIAQACYGG